MSRRCVCVDALVKEKRLLRPIRKQMSSVKKGNSSLISSECCKSSSVMEEDGGIFLCNPYVSLDWKT